MSETFKLIGFLLLFLTLIFTVPRLSEKISRVITAPVVKQLKPSL
jgi:hypothetical protein